MTDYRALAENIREFRKKQGLTQAELAEKLHVSFQSVSSWETGATIPDLANFCALAEAIHASADSLLEPRNKEEKCFIGIDGGGSKTEFVLCSSRGEVLHVCRLSASNPATVGLEQACNTLKEGVDQCLKLQKKVEGIFAGVAGNKQDEIASFFAQHFPRINFQIDSDAVNVLASDRCDKGLICGTGSIVLVRTPDGNRFLGGWGYSLGDPGSAYNIGREAMRASLRMDEGLGKPTSIRGYLCEALELPQGCSLRDNLITVNQKGVTFMAGLAIAVFRAAAADDEVALEILDREMCELMNQVNVAQKLYGGSHRMAAAGGVLEHNRESLLPLMQKYAPDMEFVFSMLPPVYGACVECADRLHISLSDDFYDTFKRDYELNRKANA